MSVVDATDDWAERARRESLQTLEGIQEMQRQLAQVSGSASAARGAVGVRVTPSGLLTQLRIEDEAMDLAPDELAAEIMRAVSDATAQASAQMRAVVGEVIPADQLDAMMRGTVAESDVADVAEQIDALRRGV